VNTVTPQPRRTRVAAANDNRPGARGPAAVVAAAVVLEAVESRRLLSAAGTATVDGTDLIVTGTSGADDIVVYADANDGDRIVVTLDGAEIGRFAFDVRADDAFLTVLGGRGDDRVTIDAGLDLCSVVHGGPGDDTLTGGDGDDTLIGCGGNDRAYGGDGDDALWGDAGRDLLHGGAGADHVRGGNGCDRFSAADADAEKRDKDASDGDDVLT
jgi:Ca2+-binding RTX toxin-like protein